MSRYKDYDDDNLQMISNIVADSTITEGSKLSLIVAEYHKLYKETVSLRSKQDIGDYYYVNVPVEKMQEAAIEINFEQERKNNAELIEIYKNSYEDLKKKVKDLV